MSTLSRANRSVPRSAPCHPNPSPLSPSVAGGLSCARSSLAAVCGMSATPSFSAEEIRRREQTLLRCFDCCDTNGDGLIDSKELEAVARAFTQANTQQSAQPSNSSTAAQQAASAGMNVDQVRPAAAAHSSHAGTVHYLPATAAHCCRAVCCVPLRPSAGLSVACLLVAAW